MHQFSAGTTLHDRYVLHHRIGDGGTAQVWQAHDRRLDRLVAIKLIPGASEPQIRREAQAAASLTHPHIAATYDFGDIGHGPDGYGYLVMELLAGTTLADRLAGGPVPWPEAARVAAQVASALVVAHERGVVHRDIKPANIMLTATGVKVLDFGIAATAHRPGDIDMIAGTPDYAAPELVHGAPPDPAADVYSLAVVVHEMLTGALPRPIHTWSDLAAADFSRTVPVPGGVDAAAAPALAAALRPDPTRRPTASALAAAFDARPGSPPWASTDGPTSPPAAPTLVTARSAAGVAGVAAAPRARPAPTSIAGPGAFDDGRSPWRLGMIAVIAVAALIAALFGYTTLRGPGGPQAVATANPPVTVASSRPAASPSPSASSVDALLTALAQEIDTADANGSIDHSRAKDLSKRVQRIQHAWAQNDLGEFRDQCQQLRDDVRHGDGGDHEGDQGDSAFVQTIDTMVAQLLAAAGPGN